MIACREIGQIGKQQTPTLTWLGDSHLVVADDFRGNDGVSLIHVSESKAIETPRSLTFPAGSPITNADFVACFDVIPLSDGTCVLVADFPDEDGNSLDQVFGISSERGVFFQSAPSRDLSTVHVSELNDGRLVSVDGESGEIRVSNSMLTELFERGPCPTNPENEEAALGGLSGWGSGHLIGAFIDWEAVTILKWRRSELDASPETLRIFERVEPQGMCVNPSKECFAIMLSDTREDVSTMHVVDQSGDWAEVEYDVSGEAVDDRRPFFRGDDVMYFDSHGRLSAANAFSRSVALVHDFKIPVLASDFHEGTQKLAVLLKDGSLHLAQF